MKLLIFIPAHNEETTIGDVIRHSKMSNPDAHVLVVDDGSTDQTNAVSLAAGAEVMRRASNGGILAASRDGFRYALDKGFDILVQVDADGQHAPEEISRLAMPIIKGQADFVIGSRYRSGDWRQAPAWRMTGLSLFALLTSISMGQWISDTTTGFRAYARSTFAAILELPSFDFLDGLALIRLKRQGVRFVEIPGALRPRRVGHSHYSLIKIVRYTLLFVSSYVRLTLERSPSRPVQSKSV